MDKSIEIVEKCVSLSKVPDSFSRENVMLRVKDILTQSFPGSQVDIVDIALIPGAAEQQGLQRWIVLFRSVEDARAFLANRKDEKIMIGNDTFTAEYQSSIECEVPEQWKTDTAKVDDPIPPPLGRLDQDVQQPSGPLPANQWPHVSECYPYCPSAPVLYPPSLSVGQPPSGPPVYPPSGPPVYTLSRPPGYPRSGLLGYPPSRHPGYPPSGPPGYPPSGPIIYPPYAHIGHPSSGFIGYTPNGPIGHLEPGQYVDYQSYQLMQSMAEHNPDKFPPTRSAQGFVHQIRYPFVQFIPVPSYHGQPQPQPQQQLQPQPQLQPHPQPPPQLQPLPQLSPHHDKQVPCRYSEARDLDERLSSTSVLATGKSSAQEPEVSEPCTYITEPCLYITEKPNMTLASNEPSAAIEDYDADEAVGQSQNATLARTHLFVSKISAEDLNEEMIRLIFESKKYGGHEVQSIQIDKEHSAAIVEFSNSEALEQIFQMRPIMFGKAEVIVDWYNPNKYASENLETDNAEKATQILVSKLPSNVNDEFLQMFFEKRQFGSFNVVSVEILKNNMAIVTFAEQEAVMRVLKVNPIQINGQAVTVEAYVPEPVSLCTIEVRGPANVINQDQLQFLQLYFENQKRSGGEEVVESSFDPEEKAAYITYRTEEVAKRVVEKGNHMLNKQKIDVKLHIPERKLPSKGPDKCQANGKNKEEEPQQPIRTVKVKGFPKSRSRSTLQFYFENSRRSGGGGEVTIESDEEDKDLLYVHFKEESVAARVADSSHTHSVEGYPLLVSLHIPPKPRPYYENRLLLKGLKSTTTKDGLFYFLEAKTGCYPVSLNYHAEDEDTVMVTFEKIDDFEKIKEAIRNYKLEEATLKAYRVPISNCIHVSNLAPAVTKDTVQYYFENARRSGGGPVEKVVMHDRDRSCLVYFNNYQVIDNVLCQEHKLNEKKLEVNRYLECLCVHDKEGGERQFRIPETIIISNTEPHKIKFLKNSPKNMDALEIQLKSCHAKVQWPNNENNNISLVCTLTKDVADSFRLAKIWQEKAKDNFEALMKDIIIHQTNILQDIWDNVMEKLKTINIPNPEGVALFVDKKDGQLTVVGMKDVVSDLAKQISDKIKEVTDKAEKERQKVKESVSNLKSIDTKMLLADKFPKNMEEKFPNLKVHIAQNKNEIMFEGACREVQEAKLAMYEIKGKFGEHTVDISTICEELYLTKQTKEHIVKKLKQQNITAAWETSGKLLHILSSSKESLQDCVEIVQGSVKECSINRDTAAQSDMNSQKWIKKVEEWHSAYLGRCKIYCDELSKEIHVCATDDIFSDLCESINTYLRLNTIYGDKKSFERSIHRLIEKHHKDKVSEIAKSLQNKHVQINYGSTYNSFEIKGTKEGIAEAMKALEVLVSKVLKKEHTIRKLGLGEYIQSIKGKDNINTIESSFPCVVEIMSQTVASAESEQSENIYETIPADHKNGVRIVMQCKVWRCTIFTAEGDMTELPVDVLVNSTNEKLSLHGGLGSVMVTKGGQSIKTACDDYVQKHGSLKIGDVFLCPAGRLKAKNIFHVVGPTFQDGNLGEDKMLKDVVLKCLEKAHARNAHSIAFPAISCGVLGYPVKQATAIIVEAVSNFVDNERYNGSIKEVWLCDIKIKTVNCFTDALMQKFGKTSVTQLHTNYDDDKMEVDMLQPAPLQTKDLTSSLKRNYVTIGNINISVIIGELAQQKVDVITNTVARNLDLRNGAVSASLLLAAGQKLQDEIRQKFPYGLKDKEVAVTSGCNLNCKIVVHGALPNYKGDDVSVKALQNLMHSCLFEAQNQKLSSVAFPALGTGNLGFPKEVVAKEMFTAVSKFAEACPQSSVTDVRFCLYHMDTQTIQAFKAEEARLKTELSPYCSFKTVDSTYNRANENYNNKDNDEDHCYEEIPGNEPTRRNNIKIIVKQGDITQEDTDCIVNSSNETLDLTQGAVSQAILKKGGHTLAMELDKKKSQMKQQRLVVTSAPGLQCRNIIHVVAQQNIQGWINIVKFCLQEADKRKMSSIAFPALGTAAGYVNPDEIAMAMVKVVTEFGKSKPSNVKEVRFVIYQANMIQLFDNATKNIDGGLQEKFKSNSVKDFIPARSQNDNGSAIPQSPKRTQAHINSDEVTFIIRSLATDVLENAVKRLETLLQRETFNKEFKDSIIKQLTGFEVCEIEAIGKQHHVRIDVDTANGVIAASGITSNVVALSDKIHVLLKDISAAEQNKNAAELMSNMIEWFFIEVTQTGEILQPYDKVLSYKIEMAFKQQLPFLEFKTELGTKYILNFSKMLEHPADDPTDCVKVIRRDRMKDSSFELPKSWTAMNGNLRVVTLQATDPEYKDIAAKFTISSGCNKILKIERVQNKTLWQQYQAKKKQLESQNPSTPNFTNEKLLWHGTASETVDSINAHGFNRSYCGKNATALGDGVYFAVNASYSCGNTYSRPDQLHVKRVYHCRVLTGEYTRGQSGMRVPPNKPGAESHALYDSVVDNVTAPSMYIIFHDTQAYPEYLISFSM